MTQVIRYPKGGAGHAVSPAGSAQATFRALSKGDVEGGCAYFCLSIHDPSGSPKGMNRERGDSGFDALIVPAFRR
jgi:hypothetical protein